MAIAKRLANMLSPETSALILQRSDALTQIRLRAGKPVQLCFYGGSDALCGEALEPVTLSRILSNLMEYSVYAKQDDLNEGFFTLDDGSRVGVCGRMYRESDRLRMAEVGSACIRLARPIPGCADAVMDLIDGEPGLHSTLLVSPPGLGKTTLLRDVARQLSMRGYTVGLADERHELAACHRGTPTLDVGPRTDVMDGCPRAAAVARLVRTMAPSVVVADEIGGEDDARALADAARCGVAVVASAHARSLEDLLERPSLRSVLGAGVVEVIILLGPRPGAVACRWRRGEGECDWRLE